MYSDADKGSKNNRKKGRPKGKAKEKTKRWGKKKGKRKGKGNGKSKGKSMTKPKTKAKTEVNMEIVNFALKKLQRKEKIHRNCDKTSLKVENFQSEVHEAIVNIRNIYFISR